VQQDDGRLAVVPGSHHLPGYESSRQKRDQLLPNEWKGVRDKQSVWRSSDLEAGDLILFNVKTVHAASQNVSGHFRISCDTRVTTAKGTRWKEQQEEEEQEEEENKAKEN
jgi:ectoine hydroxylase-related dioxygenase (phytanoyl-CoA dioxygenase family)